MPDVDRIAIYHHCPRCGSTATEVRGPQLVVCHTCDLHLYYNPCAATAAIILDPQKRVLLIRRAHEPGMGMLAFPGGFIDNDESAEDGLRREVLEETGLEVGALEFLTSRPNTYPHRGVVYRTLVFFFIARVDSFARAQPLDGAANLEILDARELRAEDLAFVSMRDAWRFWKKSEEWKKSEG
ncbi:MAG: NUDIX hydrolase [Opitutaceae bacterium]